MREELEAEISRAEEILDWYEEMIAPIGVRQALKRKIKAASHALQGGRPKQIRKHIAILEMVPSGFWQEEERHGHPEGCVCCTSRIVKAMELPGVRGRKACG